MRGVLAVRDFVFAVFRRSFCSSEQWETLSFCDLNKKFCSLQHVPDPKAHSPKTGHVGNPKIQATKGAEEAGFPLVKMEGA